MSDTIIGAIIALSATIISQILSAIRDLVQYKLHRRKDSIDEKKKNLTEVYSNLISIINMFPSKSFSDVLEHIDNSPNCSMMQLKTILDELDNLIDGYKNDLDKKELNQKDKFLINSNISKCMDAKKQISKISGQYHEAERAYQKFKKEESLFYLYAGKDVQNYLNEFHNEIENVFISGYSAYRKESDQNVIEKKRQKLICCLQKDLKA